MKFSIRNADYSDVFEIKKIADANRGAIGFILRPIFESSIKANELLVAAIKDKVIGFLRWHKRCDGWATIYEVCVNETYRRHGVGEKLISCVPKPIRLRCPADNESNGFYEHISFALAGQEKGKKRFLNIWILQ